MRPGFYVYVGSAFGPGGVKARVSHHLTITPRPRWHIDFLRASSAVDEVWITYDPNRREHQWADVLQRTSGATIPLAGFGSSDCDCKSHLFYFHDRPSKLSFVRRIHSEYNDHEMVRLRSYVSHESRSA